MNFNTTPAKVLQDHFVNNSLDNEVPMKILFVGDASTGKTSLICRHTKGRFPTKYISTIGVDFSTSTMRVNDNTRITMYLWDIAGQDRYSSISRAYYRGGHAAFVVFDVTKPSTLESALRWKADISDKVLLSDGSPIPVMLVANKHDLISSDFPSFGDHLDKLCKEHGFVGCALLSEPLDTYPSTQKVTRYAFIHRVHASALTGLNVDNMMRQMAAIVLANMKLLDCSPGPLPPDIDPTPYYQCAC